MESKPVIFISYSHRDEKEKEQLATQLTVLERAGLSMIWYDDKIDAGGDWELDIEQVMAKANLAILLVSANFLGSDFILNNEVPELLRRREEEGLMVYPIIAKPCAWQAVDWLTKMNVKPKNGIPVWGENEAQADRHLANITNDIVRMLSRKTGQGKPPSTGTTHKKITDELRKLGLK